jgi:hypothetical protein
MPSTVGGLLTTHRLIWFSIRPVDHLARQGASAVVAKKPDPQRLKVLEVEFHALVRCLLCSSTILHRQQLRDRYSDCLNCPKLKRPCIDGALRQR